MCLVALCRVRLGVDMAEHHCGKKQEGAEDAASSHGSCAKGGIHDVRLALTIMTVNAAQEAD